MFQFLLVWLAQAMTFAGYLGFFIIVTLENFLVPIPSELVLPFAGYLVYTRAFNFWIALAVSVVAAVIGSLMSYALGYYGGEPFTKRYGHWFFLDPKDLQRAHGWFLKYGSVTVFIYRAMTIEPLVL